MTSIPKNVINLYFGYQPCLASPENISVQQDFNNEIINIFQGHKDSIQMLHASNIAIAGNLLSVMNKFTEVIEAINKVKNEPCVQCKWAVDNRTSDKGVVPGAVKTIKKRLLKNSR